MTMANQPTPTLLADATTHISDDDLRLQGILFIAALVPVSILPYFVAAPGIPDLSTIHWSVSILGWIFKIGLHCYTLLVLRGFYVWWRGSLSLVKDDDAKYIEVMPNRRVIEYYVYGSEKDDATTLVVLHGSGSTGKYLNQYLFPDDALKKLNVRAISPSYPGHGGSDVHKVRQKHDHPLQFGILSVVNTSSCSIF